MAGTIRSHRDLIVWQKVMDLRVEVYGLTKKFPQTETYRLVDQVTRAAASVPANIAEGYARDSPNDYARFLAIAKGSLMEVETFLQLAARLSYLVPGEAQSVFDLIDEISRMVTRFRKKVLQSRE